MSCECGSQCACAANSSPGCTEEPEIKSLEKIFALLVPHMLELTYPDPRDEVLLRYTRGEGKFSPDKKYITLDMKMYDAIGLEDGNHQGVWHALFSNPQDLLQAPAMPNLPLNEPVGPVAHIDPAAQTKAIWTFGDGSSITAVGPAMSHLVPLADGSFVFMVTCAQIITNGTGRFEGAYGVKQSLGATFIPADVDFFGSKPRPFEATTVDTFRIVRRRYYRAPPG